MRKPLPAEEGQPERYDYEYERNGTANIFIFTEPLSGWRSVRVREHRTALDWATEIQQLLDTQYPEADRIRLVCDNLNTHGIGSLYEAFPPEQARGLASRLEIHHTPKHGSWLNIAEIEFAVLSNMCLKQRIADEDPLKRIIAANVAERNAKAQPVKWKFTTKDARVKLQRLYPVISN